MQSGSSRCANGDKTAGTPSPMLQARPTKEATMAKSHSKFKAAAVQAAPEAAGIELANWNWKVVRMFMQQRFGHSSAAAAA